MKLLDRHPSIEDHESSPNAEALIREAKDRERRRRIGFLLAVVLVTGVIVTLIGVVGGGGRKIAATVIQPLGESGPTVNVKAFTHEGDLAFVSRNVLWVLDGSNGTLRKVATNYAIDPVFSHNGKWLAYVTTGDPNPYGNVLQAAPGQLWMARSNGTDARSVRGLANASDVSWSPTDDVLAVINGSFRGSRSNVSLVSPNGSWRQLSGTSHAENFVWSPDGKSVAFSGGYGYGALKTVSVSGRGFPVIWQKEHNNPAYPAAFNPTIPAAWLPNHEGILFWVDFDDSASIEADGLPLYLVTSPKGVDHLLGHTLVNSSTVAASRTGALAIDSTTGLGRYQWAGKTVERCSTKSAMCSQVVIPPSDVSIDPSWSPNGSQLVYALGPNEGEAELGQSAVTRWYSKLSLWTVKSTGGTAVRLPLASGATNVLWSPNGSSLLFEANDALWLKSGATHKPVEIVSALFPRNEWPNYYAEVNWTDRFAWSKS